MQYLEAARDAVSLEEFKAATRKILDHVLTTGSIRAYAELRDMLAGRPTQTVKVQQGEELADILAQLREENATESTDANTH
jgi:hypothetical protein